METQERLGDMDTSDTDFETQDTERCRCEKWMDGDTKQNCKLWRLMSRDSDMKQRDYVLTYTPKGETKRQTLHSLDKTWDTCVQHRVLYTVLKRGTHMLPS